MEPKYQALRDELIAQGYEFLSETDTEVIVHLLHRAVGTGAGLFEAMRSVVARLQGAYAIAAIDRENPEQVVAAREGSPLVVLPLRWW